MEIYPTSRYTMTGVYPNSFRESGHCTPAEMDAELHRYKELTGGLPAFAITAAFPFVDPLFRFPLENMEVMDQRGVVPWVILWPYPPYGLDQINSGELDAVFRARAKEVYDWSYGGRRPCVVQFGTEIGLDVYPWGAANNGGWDLIGIVDAKPHPLGPSKYVHAHRRLWRIFAEAGCELTWSWHPFTEHLGNTLNRPCWYFPGPEYTDWVGIPHFLDQSGQGLWGTFEDGLRETLAQIEEIPGAADKPLYVEAMCQDRAGDPAFKEQFFRDLFARTGGGEFERVTRNGWALGYWDDYDAVAEESTAAMRYRAKYVPGLAVAAAVPLSMGIDSSPEALAAYREGVGGAGFTNKVRLA